MKKFYLWRLFYLSLFAYLCLFIPLYACPLCKEAISSIKLVNPGDLVKSYNISVLVMIIAPFSIVAIVGVIVWRLIKKNQRVL